MARIDLVNLAHAYGIRPSAPKDFALKAMNQAFEDGGAYALLGPSGCGKTTLLNIISGLVTPSHGQVLFDGVDVTGMPPEARNIAQVFQFPVIYDTMTVYGNLAFPLRNRHVPTDRIDARVREIARMLELDRVLDKRARGLTADAKQKISLGRGLVRSDVAAILFDEPLTVIDPHLKWQLRSQLKQLHEQFDFTMIYVTHDQTEALTFARKVVVMYEGEVVQIGTPAELFSKPAHTFVGYFIGSPGMNVMKAVLSGASARVAGGEIRLSSAYPSIRPGSPVELGIRPEFVRIARGEGVPVEVRKVEDIGRYKIARLGLGDAEIAAIADENAEIPADGAGAIFDPAHLHVYVDGHRVEGDA